MTTQRPLMIAGWTTDKNPRFHRIPRDEAARLIRGNRRAGAKVAHASGETTISMGTVTLLIKRA